ncbi:MAG: OmpH family outer membrane protein [Syntrophaceae bacterium]
MRTFRRIIAVLACFIFAALSAASGLGAEDLKFGYVDARKAMNECKAGKQAKSTIAAEIDKLQNQITDRQNELQNLKESIERQATVLTDSAKSAREREYQQKLREYQRWADEIQVDVKQKREELETNISRNLNKVIQQIGADDGYTVILEKNEKVVLYVTKAVDLTDRVIKGIDALSK